MWVGARDAAKQPAKYKMVPMTKNSFIQPIMSMSTYAVVEKPWAEGRITDRNCFFSKNH